MELFSRSSFTGKLWVPGYTVESQLPRLRAGLFGVKQNTFQKRRQFLQEYVRPNELSLVHQEKPQDGPARRKSSGPCYGSAPQKGAASILKTLSPLFVILTFFRYAKSLQIRETTKKPNQGRLTPRATTSVSNEKHLPRQELVSGYGRWQQGISCSDSIWGEG